MTNKTKNSRYIQIHPGWYEFIKYCESIYYGEIDKIKIKEGRPVLAEEVKRKVRFLEPEILRKNTN